LLEIGEELELPAKVVLILGIGEELEPEFDLVVLPTTTGITPDVAAMPEALPDVVFVCEGVLETWPATP